MHMVGWLMHNNSLIILTSIYHKRQKFGVAQVWRIWQNCIFHQTLFIQSLILSNIPYILGKFAKLYAVKLIAMQFCQPLAMPNFHHSRYAKHF